MASLHRAILKTEMGAAFLWWSRTSGLEGFSQAEVERYSRQLVMAEIGPEGQRRLKSSSVLVVGAGGLGIPASVYLAAAGVGRLGLVDYGAIERSNLHRQTLYRDEDIGKPKAVVASERLGQINPHVSIQAYSTRIESSNAFGILGGYDLVLDCSDNLPTRYLISDACVLLHKPEVYASVSGFDGQVTVFHAGNGPCYRCLYPEPPPPGSVRDCAEAGVLGVLPGIMGSIQAAQAISILVGKGEPLLGRLLLFSAADTTFNALRIRKDPNCRVCGSDPSVKGLIDYEEFCRSNGRPKRTEEITPKELKRWIDTGRRVTLLDVREPHEYELCHLDGSKFIPLEELRERVNELNKTDEMVVYCHVGSRSAHAVEILSSLGFDKTLNLRGGIRAWSEEVDPTLPKY